MCKESNEDDTKETLHRTAHLSHSVMYKESNEDDTEETLQNKQRALTSIQLVYSCVFTCFRFASTLNMLFCLLLCAFVSSFQSSSMFPYTDFSPVCEFLAIVHTSKTGLLRCCLYILLSVPFANRRPFCPGLGGHSRELFFHFKAKCFHEQGQRSHTLFACCC